MKNLFSHIAQLLFFALFVFIPQQKTLAQAPPVIWQQCYGGDSTDVIKCIKQTPDGGYIAAGYTLSVDGDLGGNGGIIELWTLKLDALGNIEWEKTYSDTIHIANYIEPTTDGGYILTGTKTIKLDHDGNVEWLANLSGLVIHQTDDGGYILCNQYDPALSKLHADGSIDWQQSYGSTIFDPLTISDVCTSFTGGYIITGTIYDIFHSPFIAKTDASGNIPTPVYDDYEHGEGFSLCKTKDGKYMYVRDEYDGSYEIEKFDDNLTVDWYAHVTSMTGIAGIASTNDNGFIAIGTNVTPNSDFAVLKFDSTGKEQWEKDMGGSLADVPFSGFQTANGNYVIAGDTRSDDSDVSGNHGGLDGWIVGFGNNVGVPQMPSGATDIKLHPVPATDKINIDLPDGYENAVLRLIDVSGNILQVKEDGSPLSRALYLNGLPGGQYLLEVINNSVLKSYKITHY